MAGTNGLEPSTSCVTDNDGNYKNNIEEKYSDYKDYSFIKICADNNESLQTLEPQFVEANAGNLDVLREVLGIEKTKYPDKNSIINYMGNSNNKTKCALKIFETEKDINFPKYILEAIT